ncbi:hypothetical protein BDZ45DRAFT_697968 [Acephala macrosclerotiorum]|nr:hypothetical protein BDZ45DRAFT_697968 [Acephala macrosclerotiorum]
MYSALPKKVVAGTTVGTQRSRIQEVFCRSQQRLRSSAGKYSSYEMGKLRLILVRANANKGPRSNSIRVHFAGNQLQADFCCRPFHCLLRDQASKPTSPTDSFGNKPKAGRRRGSHSEQVPTRHQAKWTSVLGFKHRDWDRFHDSVSDPLEANEPQ